MVFTVFYTMPETGRERKTTIIADSFNEAVEKSIALFGEKNFAGLYYSAKNNSVHSS